MVCVDMLFQTERRIHAGDQEGYRKQRMEEGVYGKYPDVNLGHASYHSRRGIKCCIA
jgi:hypothetical protein